VDTVEGAILVDHFKAWTGRRAKQFFTPRQIPRCSAKSAFRSRFYYVSSDSPNLQLAEFGDDAFREKL
jgi:hypothetical protein